MKKLTAIMLLLTAILAFASPFAKPSEPSGILKMNTPHTSKDIFPVSLFELDGKQVITRKNAVWLKPGKHSIKVNSLVPLDSRSTHSVTRQKRNNKEKKTLEINVEDGKTYYVGYDTSNRDPNLWTPVVWKVK